MSKPQISVHQQLTVDAAVSSTIWTDAITIGVLPATSPSPHGL